GTPEKLRVPRIFYASAYIKSHCFQLDSFGSWRANVAVVRGKGSRGSLRGVRAGPASFPLPTPLCPDPISFFALSPPERISAPSGPRSRTSTLLLPLPR